MDQQSYVYDKQSPNKGLQGTPKSYTRSSLCYLPPLSPNVRATKKQVICLMIISWSITAAALVLLNLVTAWQLPWITQLILISPFFIFSVFLTWKRQRNILTKQRLIILSTIIVVFIAISFGLFSEDHFMITGFLAILFPIVLIAYLLFLSMKNKSPNNGN